MSIPATIRMTLSVAGVLTENEARRIATNIAKLPSLLAKKLETYPPPHTAPLVYVVRTRRLF